MLVLVVGPSGAGKDTLMAGARAALADDKRFRFVRRVITRPQDAGGEDHIAIDADGFACALRSGAFALSWDAHGLRYGIPADIADDLAAGRVVVANVSRTVIAEAATRLPVAVLEITASPEVLAVRLAARGRESAADIAARLARQVPIPPGVRVHRVLNDVEVAEGVQAVLTVLRACAGGQAPVA